MKYVSKSQMIFVKYLFKGDFYDSPGSLQTLRKITLNLDQVKQQTKKGRTMPGLSCLTL